MSAEIARYAVIGRPIEHSLSPLIHRHFASLGSDSLSYDLLSAPADGFASAASEFFSSGGSGLNVTLPFKEAARALVDRCDSAATVAGAVNTIRRADDGSLDGFNTDGIGLVQDLKVNLGWQVHSARVLLIGAGGASRGALDALLRAGPESLTLANRTLSRAQSLVAEVAPDNSRVHICAPGELRGSYDLVINATSASLAGQGALVPTDAVAGAKCYDMLYAPQQTVFAGWALSHGASQVADGLGMLLEQAAEAYYLWRDIRPDTVDLLAKRHLLFAAKQANAMTLESYLASGSLSEDQETGSAAVRDETRATRRFIAGAVCPECREIDRIYIRDTDDGREQVCVACGYSQPENPSGVQGGAQSMVPRGKHERATPAANVALEVQTVRFIDPSSDASQSAGESDEKTD